MAQLLKIGSKFDGGVVVAIYKDSISVIKNKTVCVYPLYAVEQELQRQRQKVTTL